MQIFDVIYQEEDEEEEEERDDEVVISHAMGSSGEEDLSQSIEDDVQNHA